MKRLCQLVAATVVALLVPVIVSSSASAASTCDIGFTGPDSQNMCTSEETFTCTVNNENTVVITNSSGQTAASGSVTVGENGTGGGAVSGNAGNYTHTTFTVTITNPSREEGVCSAAVIVPATETPPAVVPTANEPTPAQPAVLPATDNDITPQGVALATGITMAITGASVGAMILYRRRNSL